MSESPNEICCRQYNEQNVYYNACNSIKDYDACDGKAKNNESLNKSEKD